MYGVNVGGGGLAGGDLDETAQSGSSFISARTPQVR
jgi:hypothetical protein